MIDADLTLVRGAFLLDAAFTTPERGVAALFGVSGSGKSSLALAIAGLIRPKAGRLRLGHRLVFDGTNKVHVPPEARRVGLVFQDSRLFPHLSVQDNLMFGARRRGGGDLSFADVVELLGLGDFLQRRTMGLSGGEARRVALGRALLSSPDLLILDEPLSGLDGARREEILGFLEALKRDVAMPILLISHALDEVTRLADYMIVLGQGRVRAHGPMAALFSDPDVIAPIAGDAWGVVIDGKIAGHDLNRGLSEVAFPGGRLKVPPISGPLGQKVRLRLPARDVILALHPVEGLSVQNQVPATITRIIAKGQNVSDVILDLGGTVLVARVTRAAVERLGLQPGHKVQALIKSVAVDRLS